MRLDAIQTRSDVFGQIGKFLYFLTIFRRLGMFFSPGDLLLLDFYESGDLLLLGLTIGSPH